MRRGSAWVNLLGGQREELVIGSGRGGQLGIYAPDGKGSLTNISTTSTLPEDLTGIVGWVGGTNNGRALVMGRDDYKSQASHLRIRDWHTPLETRSAGSQGEHGALGGGGCLWGWDAGLVCGRAGDSGAVSEAADSKLYRNVGGQLRLDEENSRVLEKVGLVNGAVWSDLDGDGYPDLILACEWGPIRVFKNEHGRLHEITKDLGLTGTRVCGME